MESPSGSLAPDAEKQGDAIPINRRAVITHGLVWTGMLQVFLIGLNFISMLVLVRLLSPAEYGKATAAIGILAVVNCFNCSYFIFQALQLREGEEPDWAMHWNAGFYIQVVLFVVCNAVASACWLWAAYRPIAGLLHVASIGLLVDFPNQLSLTRLRRELNYRTLRLVEAASALLTAISSISLALSGAGAFALIIGSNVLHGLPHGFYLLFIRKWRPPAGWWRWPVWKNYQRPLRFGAQLSGSAVLTAARGLLEASVLPATIGYEAIGLLNRAQVLFSTTVGRAITVLVETIYPLLPRSAADPTQFARHATLFFQTMLLITIPGAVFVGMEGPQLSRLLYGSKWTAADPLILPGTLFAWSVSMTLILATVLQAKNRLRSVVLSSAIAAVFCVPAIVAVLAGANVLIYAWIAAASQLLTVSVVTMRTKTSFEPNWFSMSVLPPVLAAAVGVLVLSALQSWVRPLSIGIQISLNAVLFIAALLLMLRICFRRQLSAVVSCFPRGDMIAALLRI